MAEIVTPLPAATLLLLRDGRNGIEVLMTPRPETAGFAAGALVFPGGKLEAADAALVLFCPDAASLAREALLHRIAAIRETFEECGILLARDGGAAVLAREAVAVLRRHEAAKDLARLLAAEGLRLASDLLVPFAHWITPRDRPKRFDTHFFLAEAPPEQDALHDGFEALDALWVEPAAIVREADAGHVKMIFATRMNLDRLSRHATVAEALAAARASRIVTVLPEFVRGPEGPAFLIPEEAGYGVSRIPARTPRG